MGEKSLDLWDIHILGMPLLVEQDVALDPRDIGLFPSTSSGHCGAHGKVLESYGVTNLIKQFLPTFAHVLISD